MAFLPKKNPQKSQEILSSADIDSKYVFFLTIICTEGFIAQRIQGEQKII